MATRRARPRCRPVRDGVGGDAVLFSPVLGALSDRFGRRPVILLSNLGLGLDYIVMALAPTVWWLFVGRVISGITAASFSTASAYIADVAPPEKRAAGYGMISGAFGLGFVLGPAMGGVLGNIDPRLPFWVAAGLSLLNAMTVCSCCRNRCRSIGARPLLEARQSTGLDEAAAFACGTVRAVER